MKSKKVKAYQAHKRVAHRKADLTLDESDSDVDHDDIDKNDDQLSTDDQHKDDTSEEEEVLPITDDEKDETDEADSEKDEEQDLPNRDAWGKKKSVYYSADFIDEDRGRTYREEDAEAARAEAEEAFAIQKSVYSNIKANNLGGNLFLEDSSESSGEEEKMDIISATKEEKLKYLKRETQVFEVCKEFKSAMQEYKKFATLLHLVEMKKIRSNNFEKYIRLKNQILSLYCLNLSMYMMFISSGKNPKYHPVVQRISSFKGFLEELTSIDNIVAQKVDEILEKEHKGEDVEFCSESEVESDTNKSAAESMPKDSNKIEKEEKKIKRAKTKHIETETERQVMALISEVKEERKKRKHENSDQEEEEMHDNEDEPMADDQLKNSDEKRVITYQIAKNKGLVPHRKKEYRNPRVRHRMKFRKANIRRKGQVRGVVKEIKRYAGEPTGININVVKSVKFK